MGREEEAGCLGIRPDDFVLSLSEAVLHNNNLGGQMSSTIEPTLRFGGVGINPATGRQVDLEMANTSAYAVWNPSRNGLLGQMARINVRAPQYEEEGSIEEVAVNLDLNFIDSADGTPVVLGRFHLTVFDLDTGNQVAPECVSTRGFDTAHFAPETEVTYDPAADASGNYRFCGTTWGKENDDPSDPQAMTYEQQTRAISFTFAGVSSVAIKLGIGCATKFVRTAVVRPSAAASSCARTSVHTHTYDPLT